MTSELLTKSPGPQTFRGTNYKPAEITIIVCWSLCIFDLLFIYYLCRRRNKRNAEVRAQPGYSHLKDQQFLDLTDMENPEFVYTL